MEISTDQIGSNPRSTKQQLNIEGQKIYACTTKCHLENIPEWYTISFGNPLQVLAHVWLMK